MLEKLDQNISMTKTEKSLNHKISIHHSNLFRPKPLGITAFDLNGNKEYLAVVKEYKDNESDQHNESINIIEIHRVVKTNTPKLVQSIIEYEKITGLAWAYSCHLLTVTKEQTINLYDFRKGIKVFSILTDYGPILSMKFSMIDNILITGTEYGYVALYTIDKTTNKFKITPKSKLVKVNNRIESVDFTLRAKEIIAKEQETKKLIPQPGKRKRSASSSSNDSSDDECDDNQDSFLSKYDLTIFGASKQELIAWNFHKKTIIETIKLDDDINFNVNTLTALRNGHVVVGDSKGTISIIDQNTFTCKQSMNILQADVLVIGKSYDEKTLLVSGKDPTIVILKRDLNDKDLYVIFDKIELHKQNVTCITSATKATFFSGSQDGILSKLSLKGGGKTKLKLDKEILIHNYSNHIKFSDKQMMIQSGRSLIIWRLPNIKQLSSKRKSNSRKQDSDDEEKEEDLSKLKPLKLMLLKTKGYIQASAFSSKWLCYATMRGIHIFDRTGDRLKSYGTDKKLINCNHLQLCFDDKYMIAAEQDKIYLIHLDETIFANNRNGSSKTLKKFPIIAEKSLHSSIRQICFVKWSNTIVICCLTPKYHVYILNYYENPTEILSNAKRLSFKTYEISFMTYNSSIKTDHNLYIYTNDDKIIKLDPLEYNENVKLTMTSSDINRIENLPVDINILGMFIITKDICILYDSKCMFKVDMNQNKVVNYNCDYNFIIKMDNSVFDNGNEVALVELTPENYMENVPAIECKLKKKFGT